MKYDELYEAWKQGKTMLKSEIPLEQYFQNKILEYLKTISKPIFFWKAAQGTYCKGGIPDVIAVIDGQFYAFEVKRPWIGKVSETQRQTIKKMREAGGKAYVVSFWQEIRDILEGEGDVYEGGNL